MAMYSFGMESLTSEVCRGAFGLADLWLILTVNVGTRVSHVANFEIGQPQQAGHGFLQPGGSGPYTLEAGESGVATYTVVDLGGSSPDDQYAEIVGLEASIQVAVTNAAGGAVDAAIRALFGGAGELAGGRALPAGVLDCRGLVGVYVAPFAALALPRGDEVQLSDPVTLTAGSPASCGAPPRSTAIFSVRLQPNLFTKSTPLACLAGDYTTATQASALEVFAAGRDGLAYRTVREPGGTLGPWQALGQQTFSLTAPMVAVAGAPARKDVFGTGTDGVIYTRQWRQASGWSDWIAVSVAGQFLADTPVSALAMYGELILMAVDPNGVAQSIAWNNDTVTIPWAPLPGLVLGQRTPLLVMIHVEAWVEVYGVGADGLDYHTSRPIGSTAWGPWLTCVQGATGIAEPASRRYLGLTFDVLVKANQSSGLGMLMLRVDGAGSVNKLGWTYNTNWYRRTIIPGFKTTAGGLVAGVRLGDELILYMVEAQTGRIAAAGWPMPVPFQGDTLWGGWTLLDAGPVLAPGRQVAAISQGVSQLDLFVVDVDGVARHLEWRNGWKAWSLV